MRKTLVLYSLLSLVLSACNPQGRTLQALEQEVDALGVLTQNISDTSSVGALGEAAQKLAQIQKDLEELSKQIKQEALSEKAQILKQELEQYAPSILAHQQDPSLYNLAGRMKVVLANTEAPFPQRIDQIAKLLQIAPSYYEAAKNKLLPSSIPQLELAIRKQSLGLRFLQQELPDSLAQLDWAPQDHASFSGLQNGAQLAIKDYIAWCNSQIMDYAAQTQGLK